MSRTFKNTKQGVRDLNDITGKRINGKHRGCPHFMDDVFVHHTVWVDDTDWEEGGYWANVLACSACEEVIGREESYEVQPGSKIDIRW